MEPTQNSPNLPQQQPISPDPTVIPPVAQPVVLTQANQVAVPSVEPLPAQPMAVLTDPNTQTVQPKINQQPLGSEVHPKKKRNIKLVAVIIAVVLVVVSVMVASFMLLNKPNEFTGNYSSLTSYSQQIKTDDGSYGLDVPQTMKVNRESPSETEFIQEAGEGQILKSQDNWEARILVWGKPKEGTGNSDLLNDMRSGTAPAGKSSMLGAFSSAFENTLGTEGHSNITTEPRADLSDLQNGKIVFDFGYTEKDSNAVIRGRRVLIIAPKTSFSMDTRVIEKLWVDQALNWDKITDSFSVTE